MNNLNRSILTKFSSVNLASSISSSAFDLHNYRLGSISITWTGTPVGVFKLQLSNEIATDPSTVSSASFDDIVGSSLSVSAAGQNTWVFTAPYYARFVRVVYTSMSGSGTLTVCNITTNE
jgi:hypothetical protein